MATPINKLKNTSDSDSAAGGELLDDVLRTVSGEGEKKQDPSENSSETQSSDNEKLIKSAMKNEENFTSEDASFQADRMIDQMIGASRNQRTLLDKVIDEIREPFLVMILFVIFNTGFFSKLITKYLGRYLAGDSGLNYFGVAVHSILFAAIFYILKKLLQ